MKSLFAYSTIAAWVLLAGAGALQAQDEDAKRFDWDGNIFTQTWGRARDLPTERPEDIGTFEGVDFDSLCPRPDPTPDYVLNDTTSRCREEQDFTRMRLRVNFALRPSKFVDVLYGLEVGYITFGDEDDKEGPGSGGQGSGATNLETRQLIMRIHNEADTFAGQAGVYNIGTPEGIVLAGSGAGFRLNWDKQSWASRFVFDGIRAQDNSRVDDDSNGFSDDNYQDVNLAVASWNYTGVRWLDTTLYGVYRGDDSMRIADDDGQETSRMYWGGLYFKVKTGRFYMVLHAIGNWGRFERPNKLEYLSEPARLLVEDEIQERGYLIEDDDDDNDYIQAPFDPTQNFYVALPRKKYKVNAGAGHAEIGFKATDRLEFVATAAGGSGRLGPEPDNSESFTRTDQFRTAGSVFQHSQIAVDSNGGYSIFSLGQLTGVVQRGFKTKARLFSALEAEIGYFETYTYRPPVMDYNQYHTRYPFYLRWKLNDRDQIEIERDDDVLFTAHPLVRGDSSYIGHEWNLAFTYRIFADLTLQGTAAVFTAGDGYRILKDVQYGGQIGEASISLNQTF